MKILLPDMKNKYIIIKEKNKEVYNWEDKNMLNKKEVKLILLEVEASYINYEKYLNDVIIRLLNKDDIKYLIARENDYLTLYKYNQSDYIEWLYDYYDIDNSQILNELKNNYATIYEYVQQNYIDYFVEENILNFINISKFRNMLYKNKKSILSITLNSIVQNVRNYANNEYLIKEYNLNKKLYQELLNIKRENY